MAFWSGETIKEWIPKFRAIEPFIPEQIDCAAYTLRMGREAYITPEYRTRLSKHKKIVLGRKQHFVIPPGQFAFLLTEEVVNIPPNVIAFISIKAKIKFRGLINVSGFHVDPGFRGNLIFAVYNAGPSPINLEQGMDMFLIWFANLDQTSAVIRHDDERQESITPDLIGNISREILSLQNLSKQLSRLDTKINILYVAAALLVAAAGIVATIERLGLFGN